MSDDAAAERRLDLSEFVPYRLVVLGRAMSEALGAAYAGEGLTIPEWRVLAVISQAPTIAARDVVARTPMDKMAVSRAVASLEGKGLVARAPAADRRVSSLKLSPRGRVVFDRVAAIAIDYERSLLAALGEKERTLFFEGLAKLESAVNSVSAGESSPRAAE